jgi:hypothetical protein
MDRFFFGQDGLIALDHQPFFGGSPEDHVVQNWVDFSVEENPWHVSQIVQR